MQFSNTFNKLGESFFQPSLPTPVSKPQLFLWNHSLAEQLNIPEALLTDREQLAAIFSGNHILPGSEPIATAYAGHQFGHFNPQLGDGRAHLLGEVIDQTGKRRDLQLKGSGPTPFSRGGDGRCAMGPAIREFIMSEAMFTLGVPTTQCLAVVVTGDPVYRDTVSPGAVVTRVANSHLRVGTFEYFAARGEHDQVDALCDYAIERHFPDLQNRPGNKYVLLIDKVIEKQIALIVEWMRVGFIHGVMNTDNTAISGETIDYGPCAMLGIYKPNTVFSSIDYNGRYAFDKQPDIAHWNILRFAESLLPLINQKDTPTLNQLHSLLTNFPDRFNRAFMHMMGSKFGFLPSEKNDAELIQALLGKFAGGELDYTITFDQLTRSLSCDASKNQLKNDLGNLFETWHQRIHQQKLPLENIQQHMRKHNPVVIPRNHHLEAVIKRCEDTGSALAAEEFLTVLRSPYSEIPQTSKYQTPAQDYDNNYKTFCGT